MKVIEIVNVIIDESSESHSDKFGEEISKEILPLEHKEAQEIVEQESGVKNSADISTSPDFKSHEEKRASSKIKLNYPPEVIMGNMNELTLKKRTVDKCVSNFMSYSCYLSQVEIGRAHV